MNSYYKILLEKNNIVTIRALIVKYLDLDNKSLDNYINYLNSMNIEYNICYSADNETKYFPIVEVYDNMYGYCEITFDKAGNYHSFQFY